MSDSLSVPMTGGISDSQLLLSLCVAVVFGLLLRWVWRHAVEVDRVRSEAQFHQGAS